VGVLLALSSALVYGASDFCGGMGSRRAPALAVVAISQLAGLAALLALLPWLAGDLTPAALGWGAGAGIAGTTAMVLFYRALAVGVMSVVAPVTAAAGAAVPVLFGLASGERVGTAAALGIGLALVAVVLVSAEGGLRSLRTARPGAFVPALAAGAGFGIFFVLLDRAPADAGLTPLVGSRVVSLTLIVLVALAAGRSLRVPPVALPIVLLAGLGDMAANALFLLATQQEGPLAVTAVLTSLYPVSTVLLAQVLLHERLVATQLSGVGTAAAAVVLISLPG
jgi:drug/metabolite transporter (DMT)-like permease